MKSCILIPSYNTGSLLKETVLLALKHWDDVFVVIDGSTDGSDENLESIGSGLKKQLVVHRFPKNQGKGSAVLAGITIAKKEGFTHALTMDADGQHPPESIKPYMDLVKKYPEALILGDPIFDESAPEIRLWGRKISNWWANFFTLKWGINDSLFGMRVYPIDPLLEVFHSTTGCRRFDFDPECAVRLCWKNTPMINIPTPVRYLTKEEGGVSQFKYVRDNILFVLMYARILIEFILRLPQLVFRELSGGNPLKSVSID